MDSFLSALLPRLAELLLVSLPQNLSIVIGIFAFNNKKIDAKKFWTVMIISLAVISVIRLLPIELGIRTLLNMILLILLGVYLLKFPIRKTIISVFFVLIVIALLELLSMVIITWIYGVDGYKEIMNNNLTFAIAGFPSSVLLFGILSGFYYFFTRHIKGSEKNGDSGDKNS